jgi:hypothetical protein
MPFSTGIAENLSDRPLPFALEGALFGQFRGVRATGVSMLFVLQHANIWGHLVASGFHFSFRILGNDTISCAITTLRIFFHFDFVCTELAVVVQFDYPVALKDFKGHLNCFVIGCGTWREVHRHKTKEHKTK